MHVSEWPNAGVSSIILAGLYIMVGLGWVLLFRATQVLNFATGQLILLGACLYYTFTASLHLPFVASLVLALVVMTAIGAAVHGLLIRRVSGTEGFFAPVILTLGLSTVIAQAVNLAYGSGSLGISVPLGDRSFRPTGSVAITSIGLIMLVLGLAALFAMQAIIRRSRWGIQMRAAAESTVQASQSGINVDRVFLGGWAATAFILTLVGITYGTSTIVTPSLADIGLRGLAVAIVGGFDSLTGLAPAALIVALSENFSVVFFGESVRDAAVMVVILIVLAIRPQGLFGSRSVVRV
jgi:branched-chain amino acid transport system permease protein